MNNYLKNLMEKLKAGELPVGVHCIEVAHDDSCSLFAGKGTCNCDSTIKEVENH